MANTMRDYIVDLYVDLEGYNRRYEAAARQPLIYKMGDKESSNFFIVVDNFDAELKLQVGIASPNKQDDFFIEPELIGVTSYGEWLFQVMLKDEHIAIPGTWKFEIYVQKELEDGTVQSTTTNDLFYKVDKCIGDIHI